MMTQDSSDLDSDEEKSNKRWTNPDQQAFSRCWHERIFDFIDEWDGDGVFHRGEKGLYMTLGNRVIITSFLIQLGMAG